VLEEWRLKFAVREKGRFDLVTDADSARSGPSKSSCTSASRTTASSGRKTPPARPGRGRTHPYLDRRSARRHQNYVHDCPLYCVSIGLQVAGELVVGVVLEPSRNELFSAAQGQGAWLNDRRLQTSQAARLEEALLATGFPPDVRGQERTLDWWRTSPCGRARCAAPVRRP